MEIKYFITNIWVLRLLSLLYREVESQDTRFLSSISTSDVTEISVSIFYFSLIYTSY